MKRKIDPNVERSEWTSAELLAAHIPAPEWLVPNYLPIGLTVLAGRPFAGKSWLALQLAQAIDQGGTFFDEIARKGNVLYIAKEDANWSLQERILKQSWVGSQNLKIFTDWPRFKLGGMKKLRDELNKRDYKLVILDSLYKFLSGSKNERDGEMEPVMSELHDMYKKGLVDAIVPLVHNNKGSVIQADGGENSVIGDTALMGVADNLWSFYRRVGKGKRMFLHTQGRMMPDTDVEVRLNTQTLCWELATNKVGVNPDTIRGLIYKTLDEQKTACTATVVAELTDKPLALIQREMVNMATEGQIMRLRKRGQMVPYILKEHMSLSDVM